MEDPIRYYKDKFGIDLLRVTNATRATIKDRISVASLIPAASCSGGFCDTAAEFQKVRKKPLFLFCFYFSALIDQAIHSALREEHPHFDRLARYPKFCGILGSYHTNLHPALLLLVATLYTVNEDPTAITSDFETLSTFFPSDYYRFLVEEYPGLTGRLQTPAEQQRAAVQLFTELSNATAMLYQPVSLRPYSDAIPDHNLFTTWSGLVASNINKTLDDIEQSSGPDS
jgi:hypothetical protein